MGKYRVTVKQITLYTKEEFNKVEYTDDFQAAMGAYIIYIENPETQFCCVDVVGKNGTSKKIIAAYNIQ